MKTNIHIICHYFHCSFHFHYVYILFLIFLIVFLIVFELFFNTINSSFSSSVTCSFVCFNHPIIFSFLNVINYFQSFLHYFQSKLIENNEYNSFIICTSLSFLFELASFCMT
jgi:hypothetical protein